MTRRVGGTVSGVLADRRIEVAVRKAAAKTSRMAACMCGRDAPEVGQENDGNCHHDQRNIFHCATIAPAANEQSIPCPAAHFVVLL